MVTKRVREVVCELENFERRGRKPPPPPNVRAFRTKQIFVDLPPSPHTFPDRTRVRVIVINKPGVAAQELCALYQLYSHVSRVLHADITKLPPIRTVLRSLLTGYLFVAGRSYKELSVMIPQDKRRRSYVGK